MRIRDLFLGAVLVLGAAPVARADNSREVARAHYARGVDLAGKNLYAEALQEFNEAYVVSPEFAVLYNIGECHIALGHPTDAMEALGRYLREGGERIPAPRREFVKKQLDLLGYGRMPELPGQRGERAPAASTEASLAARETARAHVSRGNDLAARNQYGAALREFVDAYAADGDTAILYDIGRCHMALGHPVEAIEAFGRYLAEDGERVPAGRGDLLGAQIAMLESRIAELTIVVTGPDARVRLDGRELGRSPVPIRLNAGSYHVTVTPDIGPAVERDITIAEAQRMILTVRLPFLPAGWSPATAARVRASAASAARAAMTAAIANEAVQIEKIRAASSQQGSSGGGQQSSSSGGGH